MARTKYIAELRQDLGYGLRLLRRAPGFTAVAVVTLALGIGASTTIFTIVDGVLLRPLRFPDAQRLTMLSPSSGSRLSPDYLHEWRLGSRTLQDMAGWHDGRANLTGRGDPVEVRADRVTTNFFAVLGTPARVGRTFTTARDLRRTEPEVVLSHGFWQRHFGGDPGIVGKPITLDDERPIVVGVMPPDFKVRTTELAESRAEIWLPLPLVPDDGVGMGGNLHVVARLAPGATFEQARAELMAIARRLEAARPSYSRTWSVEAVPLLDATVRDVRSTLLVLFGAVGILLLAACANVASLAVSRAAARQAEVAVRLSLGSTPGRLVRQLLTESLLLAGAAAVVAMLLAIAGTRLLLAALPAGLDLPRAGEVGIDPRMFAFALTVTGLAVVIFGLVPAFGSARLAPVSALRGAARGLASGRGRNRLHDGLVVAEVALALVLLAGAGLLARSFQELARVDLGFRAEQLLTMRTSLPEQRYDTDARVRAFGGALMERLADLPGASGVGFANYLPLSRFGAANMFDIAGRPAPRPDERPTSWVSVVGGRYFEAMGIPLLRGRLPGPADTERSQPVFVINERLARDHWPNGDAIGARIAWDPPAGEEPFSGEIVGIVGDVRWAIAREVAPAAYLWFPQVPQREITIVARSSGDPAGIAAGVAAHVRAIDPNQPVADVRAMQAFVADDLARPRFTMLLLGSFAAVALVLAAIGLYGVIAFNVAQRTREIGVRVALGARGGDVLRLVMRRGLLLVAGGLGVGIVAALALGRLVAGLLYGLSAADPATLSGVALFLAVVAAIAIYVPARRATRVDPMVALRAD